ncbi:hypothetical protein GCM10020331_016460 [Ectobacillus funiculus]
MRVLEGDNALDKTSIHPERYDDVTNLLEQLGFTVNDLGEPQLKQALEEVNVSELSEKNGYRRTDFT